MKMSFVLLLGLLLGTEVGCVTSGQHDEFKKSCSNQDLWFNDPSNAEHLDLRGGNLISDDRIFEVGSNHESEAEKMLALLPIAKIEIETARIFVGNRFQNVAGFAPFLTRGLYCSKGNGSWRLYELADKLQVAHFCLGNQKMETHRQALVVFLKAKPAEVYVFCGGAQ